LRPREEVSGFGKQTKSCLALGVACPYALGTRLEIAYKSDPVITSRRRTPLLGSQDLIVGLVIVVVLFGAKKIPELAGSIGKSLKEFKKGVEATEEEPAAPTAAQVCASCQLPMQPDWQHCPRCGASTG
jgi:sec-independent protein translocase protein TatA